jgi:hypothetical protein
MKEAIEALIKKNKVKLDTVSALLGKMDKAGQSEVNKLHAVQRFLMEFISELEELKKLAEDELQTVQK